MKNDELKESKRPSLIKRARELKEFSSVDLAISFGLPESVIATMIRESGLFEDLPNTDRYDPYMRSYFKIKE